MNYEVRGKAFTFPGVTDVSDCKTSKEVMIKAGLNWGVEKCEVWAAMPSFGFSDGSKNSFVHGQNLYKPCPNAFATFRTDTNQPLGLVKERYTPVQNEDAFTFFDNAIGKNEAIWQTAGCFGNGERIFVSAKLPQNIIVGGQDVVENYLVFSTTHDGSSGIKILFTPIRLICFNMMNAAIKNASNYITFRHTKSVNSKLDTAHEILGICKRNTMYIEEALNAMNNIKMTDKEAEEIIANVIFTSDELIRIKNTGHTIHQIVLRNYNAICDAEISMKKVNQLTTMWDYYFFGIGQKECVGTAYGVYNAVNGYYSNVDKADGYKRMDSILYGDKSRKIELAGNLVFETA